MNTSNIPFFLHQDINELIHNSIVSVEPFIERIFLSVPGTDLDRLMSYLIQRDEDDVFSADKVILKGVKEKLKCRIIQEEYDEKAILYEKVAKRKDPFLFLLKPDKKFLESLSYTYDFKVESAQYSVDFICRDEFATRFIFDTLVSYSYFPRLSSNDNHIFRYNYKDIWKMKEGKGSKYIIQNKNDPKTTGRLVTIKEHDSSLSFKSPFKRNKKKIDRVRVSIWSHGKEGGLQKTPLRTFISENKIKEVFQKKLQFKTVSRNCMKEDSKFATKGPLHKKIRLLRALKNSKYTNYLINADKELAFLKYPLDKSLSE